VRLIVTRPQPEAERTAAALRRAGHAVEVAALLRIESLPVPELRGGPWSALVVTSANALRALDLHPRRAELLEQLLGLRVFAIGRRTAAAARAAGFSDAEAAGRNVQELTQRLRAWAQAEPLGRDPLLYLAGEDRSGDLPGALGAAGQSVTTVVVYRAIKADRFPHAIAAALAAGQIEGVLHFSRRSAEAYMDCARAGGILAQALAVVHFCLSAAIAEPLSVAGAKRTRIAARPEEAALLELVEASA
jgi:uroporphyrinogen-III synthase